MISDKNLAKETEESGEPLLPVKQEPDPVITSNPTLALKRNRTYDAFVLYRFDTDDAFITNHLSPELYKLGGFRLFIHSRDFIRGRNIKENIEEAIESSNSAIIVMSQGFVDSMWRKEELHRNHERCSFQSVCYHDVARRHLGQYISRHENILC